MLVDALQASEGVVVVAALHHELGALGEGEEPEAERQRGHGAGRDEPVPRVVREAAALDANALDRDDAPRDHWNRKMLRNARKNI